MRRQAYALTAAPLWSVFIALLAMTTEARAATVQFSAPAQPMAAALSRLAQQSGLQLLFSGDQVRGLRSASVSGRFEPRVAFEIATRNTALTVRIVDDRTVVVTRDAVAVAHAAVRRSAAAATNLRHAVAATPLDGVVVTGRPLTLFTAGPLRIEDTVSLSADAITRHPATTIADVIAQLPGVAAFADMGLGQAATGEHEFVTVQGMAASYNVLLLDGVRAPSADPSSRAVSLKMIAPFGLSSIEVDRTQTAEAPGDVIGGLVEVRTPSAFDFARSFGRIAVQAGVNGLAGARGLPDQASGVEFEFARRFGAAGAFGLYANVYRDRRRATAEAAEVLAWTPTLESESQLTDFSKIKGGLSAEGYKYDVYLEDITRYGANFSLDRRANGQSQYIRLLYSFYRDMASDSQMSVRTGDFAPGQVNPSSQSGYDASGVFDPGGLLPGHYFQLRDQISSLTTVQAGGSDIFRRLDVAYQISYSYSREARPDYIEASFYGLPMAATRTRITFKGSMFPSFELSTPAASSWLFSQDSNRLWKLQGSDGASANGTFAIKTDASSTLDAGLLHKLRFGAAVELSQREQYQHEFFGGDGGNFTIVTETGAAAPYYDPQGPTVSSIGGRNIGGVLDGAYLGPFRVFDRNAILALAPDFYQGHFARDPATGRLDVPNPGSFSLNDYNGNTVFGNESIIAAYASTEWELAAIRAIAGLRYEYSAYEARYWLADATTGAFQRASRGYGELLPSLAIAYPPAEGWIVRAAVRKGLSRPPFGLLSSPATVTRDDLTGAVQAVAIGNIDLKPAESINTDVSVEFKRADGGRIAVSAYDKALRHFIYTASVTGGFPGVSGGLIDRGGVLYSEPQNGRSGWLLGGELEARQPLAALGRVFQHVAVAGDATWQNSSVDSGRADHLGRRTWLPESPQAIFNLHLDYDGPRLNAALSYRYNGLQLVTLSSDNLDNYLQPTTNLSLRLSCRFIPLEFSFTADNILDSYAFWKTLGKSKTYLGTQDAGGNGSYVETGRNFRVNLGARW